MLAANHKRLHGLDLLRALAILLVFFYHYGRQFPHPEWIYDTSHFGWSGVDLFFVLSGYLIASPLLAGLRQGTAPSLAAFYRSRAFRILPAYLLVVALYFFVPALRERSAPAPLWKFLTFTQNFGLDLRTQGAFSHAWSLCVEEHFYLVFPLLPWWLARRKNTTRAYLLFPLVLLAGLGLRYGLYLQQVAPALEEGDGGGGIAWLQQIYYPSYCRLDGLLTGVGLAALQTFRPAAASFISRNGNGLLAAGTVLLVLAAFLCADQLSFPASVWGFPVVSLGYGLLVAGAVSPSSIFYRVQLQAVAWIARLSYGAYLVHKFVIFRVQLLLEGFGLPGGSNITFVICLLATFAAAWLLYRLVEKPFLHLRNRLQRKEGGATRKELPPTLDTKP